MTSKNRGSLVGMFLAAVIAVGNLGCGGGTQPPPISVNALASAQTIDESRSANITASVVNDPANKGVIWSLSGSGCAGSACGTLSNQTATSVTYTAPSTVTATLAVNVVATSVADATKSAFAPLTVVPPPSVTTTSLPGGTGGGVYKAVLQESGGVPPFSWSVMSGSLPSGITLSADGTISGTPCATGISNFTAQLADSATPPLTASTPLNISVTVVPLSISTTSLPNGVTDTIYDQAVQVAGGISPYTWSVTSGSLPSWATLDSSTGAITGIPGTTGTENFALQVAESGCAALTSPAQALSISVVSQASANDSELSGHYAFLFNGFDDATGSQVAIVGSFTADGKGNITEGTEDENGHNGAVLNVPLTGTYNISSDNQGALTILTATGTKTYSLVLNSISGGVAHKARFVEFDDTTGTNGQRGSGLLRLQDPSAFSLGSIKGPYAFGLSGQNPAGNREAIVGAFNTDGTGMITSGVADQNVAGAATNPSLTGTYTAPSSSDGRASIRLSPSGASSLNLAAYVVSAGEFLGMTTDMISSNGLVSGTILSQTSASFDSSAFDAPAVYYQLGVDATATSYAELGLMTADGKGGLTINTDLSTLNANLGETATANYAVLSTGRVTITIVTASSDLISSAKVLYLVDKNQAFFLDTGTSVGLGFVEPQAAAPSGGFANSSFSGTFSAATISPSFGAIANATGLATLDGKGNFSETASLSATSGLFVKQTTTGTYSVAGNGGGTVTSLVITTAGIGGSLMSLFLLLSLLLGHLTTRRNPTRRALAAFGVAILVTSLLAVCPRPKPTNQFVFYIISPAKAVMMYEASSGQTPGITILEQ